MFNIVFPFVFTKLRLIVLVAGNTKSHTVLIAIAASTKRGLVRQRLRRDYCRLLGALRAARLEESVARMPTPVRIILAAKSDVQHAIAIGDNCAVRAQVIGNTFAQ